MPPAHPRLITSLVALVVAVVVSATACTPPTAPPNPPPTTSPTSSPATTAPPASSWQDTMLAAVNTQRAAVGAAPLSRCASLERAAQAHSADQAATRTMTHTGSDGSTLGTRATRAGYVGWTALAENVAMGYTSVSSVMTGWMNSSGHRANLLSSSYVHVGFGLADDGAGVAYWTQDFGRSGSC